MSDQSSAAALAGEAKKRRRDATAKDDQRVFKPMQAGTSPVSAKPLALFQASPFAPQQDKVVACRGEEWQVDGQLILKFGGVSTSYIACYLSRRVATGPVRWLSRVRRSYSVDGSIIMSGADGDVGTALTEEMLEGARSDREGLAWWLDELDQQAVSEGPPISSPPSKTPISDRAFDMIVEFEVSSQQLYTTRYRHPVWPGGASGVTVGIGYDIGYTTKSQLHADWDGAIDPAVVVALERAIGVQGAEAKGLAATMASGIDIGWDPAIAVHRTKVIPRWVGLAESRLPNTGPLGPDSLGALVSLIYNRGASFDAPGDRYTEMRAIKAHMAAKAFASIPGDLRAMKRLWPTVPGLQARREREAQLFQRGLDAAATG